MSSGARPIDFLFYIKIIEWYQRYYRATYGSLIDSSED